MINNAARQAAGDKERSAVTVLHRPKISSKACKIIFFCFSQTVSDKFFYNYPRMNVSAPSFKKGILSSQLFNNCNNDLLASAFLIISTCSGP